jgi:hypothetical protein
VAAFLPPYIYPIYTRGQVDETCEKFFPKEASKLPTAAEQDTAVRSAAAAHSR